MQGKLAEQCHLPNIGRLCFKIRIFSSENSPGLFRAGDGSITRQYCGATHARPSTPIPGAANTIFNNAAAGPVGVRRFCSQKWMGASWVLIFAQNRACCDFFLCKQTITSARWLMQGGDHRQRPLAAQFWYIPVPVWPRCRRTCSSVWRVTQCLVINTFYLGGHFG